MISNGEVVLHHLLKGFIFSKFRLQWYNLLEISTNEPNGNSIQFVSSHCFVHEEVNSKCSHQPKAQEARPLSYLGFQSNTRLVHRQWYAFQLLYGFKSFLFYSIIIVMYKTLGHVTRLRRRSMFLQPRCFHRWALLLQIESLREKERLYDIRIAAMIYRAIRTIVVKRVQMLPSSRVPKMGCAACR